MGELQVGRDLVDEAAHRGVDDLLEQPLQPRAVQRRDCSGLPVAEPSSQ